jgi:hypothetical protein
MAGGFDAGAVIGRLELGLAGWKKSVEEVKKDQQSLSGFAMRHKDEIEKLGKGFTIVGGAITAALGAAVIKTANFGDTLNDLSQRTGVATEILSGYKLAADNSGTSLDGLATGLKILSRNMFDASTGTGTAKDAFDFLGISVVNADGTLRDSNEVMLDVAERFKGMENGAQKTALSMDIFGKSGSDLIPMLNMGRKGLEENYQAAERFGMIVSKEAAKAADEFNDSLGNMKASLSGATHEIGAAIMPAVQGLVEKVTNIAVKTREWAAEHPGLVSSLGSVAGTIGLVMMQAGPLLIALPKLVQGWTTLVAVLHTSSAALAASLAGLTALAAGAVMVYTTINTMIKAKEASVEADYAMSTSNDDVGKKLRALADSVGVTRAELVELTRKYGDNNLALQQAINKGNDQDAVLQKLHAGVIKHREELAKQNKELEEAKKKLEGAAAGGNQLHGAVKKIVELMPTAIGAIRNIEIPVESLGVTMLEASDRGAELWDAVNKLDGVKPKIDTGEFESGCNAMEQAWANMVTNIAQGWSAAFVDMFGLTEALIGEATQHNQEYFDGALEDLAAEYDVRKQYILDNIADADERATALADLDAWYAGEKDRIIDDMERSEKEHAESAEQRANSLWTKMKTVFGNAIEGMLTAWLTGFVSKFLASITDKILPGMDTIGERGVSVGETAGKALSGIGKAIEDIVTAILDVIEDIAQTVVDIVAYAIETLAQSIANAATSLAAAAPSLLIVGGIALALYAGFQAINSLIGSGGGGSGDGMGRVVERLDIFLAGWTWWYLDMAAIASFIQGQNDHRADQLDNLSANINSAADRIVDAIAGIPGAAEGALVTGPTLVRVGENAPHEEEVIMPLPELGAFARNMAAAGIGTRAGGGVTVNLNGPLIHTTGVSRSDLERAGEDLVDVIQRQLGRYPAYA